MPKVLFNIGDAVIKHLKETSKDEIAIQRAQEFQKHRQTYRKKVNAETIYISRQLNDEIYLFYLDSTKWIIL